MPALKNDGLDFLRQLSFAMQSNPVKPQDKGLFGQFSRMGLTDKEFDERNISPAVLEGVKRGLQDAPMLQFPPWSAPHRCEMAGVMSEG